MRNNNFIKAAELIVKESQISLTHQSMDDDLPKYPDSCLSAISNILGNWHLADTTHTIALKELPETKIPLPFIASFKKGDFVPVNHINENQVTASNDRWTKHLQDTGEFKNFYKETILAFQKEDGSGEPDYAAGRRKEFVKVLRIPFIISSLFSNQSYLSGANWNTGYYYFLKQWGWRRPVYNTILNFCYQFSLIYEMKRFRIATLPHAGTWGQHKQNLNIKI